MEEKLDKILSELQFIKENTVTKEYLDNKNFVTKEYLNNKNFVTKEYLDNKNFVTKEYLDNKNFVTKEYLDKNFATKQYINNNFVSKEYLEQRFDRLTREISEELRNLAEYMSREFQSLRETIKQQGKRIDKIEKEEKLAHNGYDSRLYKMELAQSNLELKVYDLEKEKLVSNE